MVSGLKILILAIGLVCVGVIAGAVVLVLTNPVEDDEVTDSFQLSIIHFNDFHARFDETSTSSGPCKTDCIGGFSRLYSKISDLKETRKNPLVLNAGDNFQGTLWYTLFKWNVTQHFLNMIPTDAITLGNHEFDDNIEGLIPFLENIKAPVVVSNIDDTLEPSIQGLYQKSVVLTRSGRKIGIVGVIVSTTDELSYTGDLKFLEESQSVNAEAQRLLDEEEVFTVIVLSHCGYDVEQRIARNAIPGISVIVGAHSHTLLYNGVPPNGEPFGDYPTVVEHGDGRKVLVVQAAAYTKYLGDLVVDFDDKGNVLRWEGDPIYLDGSVPQDPEVNELLAPWRKEVEEEGRRALGESKVRLDQGDCRISECSLGNFITDAMVAHYVNKAPEGSWTNAPIAFINSGGIRTDINIGEISFDDLATTQPFGSTVDSGELQGKYIKEILEHAATPSDTARVYSNINLLQVSGIRVIIDLSQPEGSRVTSLKVRCNTCEVPSFEALDPEAYYRIATTSFVISGGDGYTQVRDYLRYHEIGDLDTDVISKYIEQQSPVITGLDDRIKIIGDTVLRYHD